MEKFRDRYAETLWAMDFKQLLESAGEKNGFLIRVTGDSAIIVKQDGFKPKI